LRHIYGLSENTPTWDLIGKEKDTPTLTGIKCVVRVQVLLMSKFSTEKSHFVRPEDDMDIHQCKDSRHSVTVPLSDKSILLFKLLFIMEGLCLCEHSLYSSIQYSLQWAFTYAT
jgi:hypothetical protein